MMTFTTCLQWIALSLLFVNVTGHIWGAQDGTDLTGFYDEDSRDLTDAEVSMIYGHVIDTFKEAKMDDAAERAENEFKTFKAANSVESKRRILQSDSTEEEVGLLPLVKTSDWGVARACPKQPGNFKCVKLFGKILSPLFGLLANEAHDICTKPDNKRQRSAANCCGKGTQVTGLCSKSLTDWSVINCCGAFQASDGWCYADHGKYPYIDGDNVCPINKWTCSRFGFVPGELCAKTTGDCTNAVLQAWTKIGEIVLNVLSALFTDGASLEIKAADSAIKAGARAAKDVGEDVARKVTSTALRTSIRNSVKKGVSGMWKNLSSNMKGYFKGLPDALDWALLQEYLQVSAAKQHEADLKKQGEKLAWELGSIADPTGITAFVNYLEHGPKECKYAQPPSDDDMTALQKEHEALLKSGCEARTQGKSCPDIHDEKTCLTSYDSRKGFYGQWCVWCMGEGCTGTDTNLCEPKNWLDTQKDISTYQPCIFKPPSPDVASNCGGYLLFKNLPKDWCSELSEYAICGIGDGKILGSGYDCKFEPHDTGSCKDLNSGNECNKFQIDPPKPVCHYETKEMDCGEGCPTGWNEYKTTGCGCCSSVFSCGHCHKWCRKQVCETSSEKTEQLQVNLQATFDGSQGRSDKVLQDTRCACPQGRRELLVNPTSLECIQGYKLKPDYYEYQCSDGSWIDCSGPSWICMGPHGELVEPSIRKDVHSIFYNASAAMDKNRLVLILAVLGICSSLFYGVQYARKLFVAEYTPIFEAEA